MPVGYFGCNDELWDGGLFREAFLKRRLHKRVSDALIEGTNVIAVEYNGDKHTETEDYDWFHVGDWDVNRDKVERIGSLHDYYGDLMRYAYFLAEHSPDPSTKNAALLIDQHHILAKGINAFPVGVKYLDERWERPGKYHYIEHAERAVIYSAARQGIVTEGLTMICPWAACADCCRAIICAGLARLVLHHDAMSQSNPRWHDSCKVGWGMLEEAGVEIVRFEGKLGGCANMRNGEIWQP